MSFLIRKFEISDYIEVRNLIPLVSRCDLFLTEDELQSLLNYESFFPLVVEKDNLLVAYGELHILPHFGRRKDARIERLVVNPNFRNQGIATALCQALIQKARDLDCGRIDLTVENKIARHIYIDRLGFEKEDTEVLRLML